MKTGVSIKKIAFRAGGYLLTFLTVFTAQAGEVQPLQAARIGEASVVATPGKLAIDGKLDVYVVDTYKNRVQKFDSAGNLVGSIKAESPSAVASGRNGEVYIGSHRDYSVGIYKNGKRTGWLGSGPGEFSSILDLAVDDITGDVYVADALKNSIRIYTASGASRGSFSGFNAPLAVAVSLDDVYILDSPVTSSYEGPGTASRISVFSKSGTYRRSIDEQGTKDRYMTRPVDIAADAMGNIYVADAGNNAVLVYDKQGAFIGRMAGGPDGIKNSVALALSRDGRLYVSSSETHSIVEIGLAGGIQATANVSVDFKSKTGAGLAPAVLGY